jgi:histidine ammonia-lyase
MLKPEYLNLSNLVDILNKPIELSIDQEKRIIKNRLFIENKLAQNEPVYGISTGFGPLVNQTISKDDQILLQYNLLQQLSCNSGPVLNYEISRLIFFLRIHALSQARSGISSELIKHMIKVYNAGISPLFKQFGSVGASGDLVPLAQLGRILIGKDACISPLDEKPLNTNEVLQKFGIQEYHLKEKEGLAIVNGTTYSCGITAYVFQKLNKLIQNEIYPLIALHWLIFNDSLQHLSEKVYQLKAHSSAQAVATTFREWLSNIHVEESHGVPQPPYSSRSVVLWLGAAMEQINHAENLIETEMNSVDDNPLFFHEDNLVLHAANFQGTYIALAADELNAGMTHITLLLERIVNRLTHRSLNDGLPAFLADEPVGLNSGLQGLQLLITSLTADLRTRAQRYSLSSIPTNADNQDVVSMSANAAHASLEALERFTLVTTAFKLMILRAIQLRDLPELSKKLQEWLENEQIKLNGIHFNDPNLNYADLLTILMTK